VTTEIYIMHCLHDDGNIQNVLFTCGQFQGETQLVYNQDILKLFQGRTER
jgi:hypothetical protein